MVRRKTSRGLKSGGEGKPSLSHGVGGGDREKKIEHTGKKQMVHGPKKEKGLRDRRNYRRSHGGDPVWETGSTLHKRQVWLGGALTLRRRTLKKGDGWATRNVRQTGWDSASIGRK